MTGVLAEWHTSTGTGTLCVLKSLPKLYLFADFSDVQTTQKKEPPTGPPESAAVKCSSASEIDAS